MSITSVDKLNKRIKFYSAETIKDPHGKPELTLTEELACWCGIKQSFIKDVKAEIGTKFEDSKTFVIREKQKKEIKNEWFILYQRRKNETPKKYEIIKINPDDENDDFMVIVAKKVT